jgi:hypothetical protein
MGRVFISFIHEDEPVASAVQNLLAQELNLNDEVFLSSDRSQVYAGVIWLDKIKGALGEAGVVVLMMSSRSVRRPWVNFEAGGAWLAGKTVIPCCFGTMTKARLAHPYSSIQSLDLPGEAFYLLESVYHHLDLQSAKPTSPFVKALRDIGRPKKEGLAAVTDELSDPYKRLYSALDRFRDESYKTASTN